MNLTREAPKRLRDSLVLADSYTKAGIGFIAVPYFTEIAAIHE
ncbi:hypothetical protein [Neisseria iguanae]|nr:hypothetical protein [Neisseria iguanae]